MENKRKIKVMCVFGTRPEATKMLPVIFALEKTAGIETKLCVTAQHRELLDGVLVPFGVKPDFDLNLMKQGQGLPELTSRALEGVGGVLSAYAPDLMLVHGDTTTTFAASLAGFYAGVKVGHVEAGLRTYDKQRPYPEEMNRRLTAALADYSFAPTAAARDNLLAERVNPETVYVTGNTAIDIISRVIKDDYTFINETLNNIDFTKRVITMTAHRRESWGPPLESINRAAARIAEDFKDVLIIYAMHPNPRVTEPARRILGGRARVLLTGALDFRDMLNLMRRSYLIYTDSGGLQEEAAALDKPLVLARETTERPEGLAAGTLTLAGVDENSIYAAAAALLTDGALYKRMASAKNPFGDGRAGERVAQAVAYEYGLTAEKPLPFEV